MFRKSDSHYTAAVGRRDVGMTGGDRFPFADQTPRTRILSAAFQGCARQMQTIITKRAGRSEQAGMISGQVLLRTAVLVAAAVAAHPVFAQSDPAGPAGPDAAETAAVRAAIPTSPQDIVAAIGYPFAAIFVVASIVALWSAIERLVLLRRRRVIPRAFVDRFLLHLRTGRMDQPNAVAVCQQNGSPVAEVFLHGIRKWGRPAVEVEQAVMDGGERQVALLKRRLRVLNGVATITPLIGLLGTVTGMIEAFNNIADSSNAMGQAEILASGIALALLTTAIGLFIAIPALTAYMYLAGRIDALVVEMDRLGQEIVWLISAEALRDRGEVSPAESPRSGKQTARAST